MLTGSLCWTSGHQKIVLIFVLQKKIPFYAGGATRAQEEKWKIAMSCGTIGRNEQP